MPLLALFWLDRLDVGAADASRSPAVAKTYAILSQLKREIMRALLYSIPPKEQSAIARAPGLLDWPVRMFWEIVEREAWARVSTSSERNTPTGAGGSTARQEKKISIVVSKTPPLILE